MGVQIGAKPDSGFDDPIGMLRDCHRRIERFLHVLCLVAGRAADRSLTAEEAGAVESALHYFREGGMRHTADEEESLFPRLRAECAEGELEELGDLESDHLRASEFHASIEALYKNWMEKSRLSRGDEERILSATVQLKHLYEEHIQVEEQAVFPRAAALLDSRAITTMGEEFRARRK